MKIKAYAQAGFREHLLPILPPDATISASSKHPEHVKASRGKVPGKRAPDGWVGFGAFTQHVTSESDVERWSDWGGGLGLQGRAFPGVDIDVEHAELAELIELECLRTLGHAPARFGRGSRRLLVYRGEGFKKRRMAFRLAPGTAGDHVDEPGPGTGDRDAGDGPVPGAQPFTHAVEFLADGQQFVVEGVHPKTGKPYSWRDGRSPVEVGAAGLVVVTAEALDALFAKIEFLVTVMWGGEIVTSANASARGDGETIQDNLLAPSLGAVKRALEALPNDVDYDTWLKVGAAVKAATGEDELGYDMWEDWSLQWPENTPEDVRAKWDSLRAPYHVGWVWLSQLAHQHGFSAAAEEFAVGASNAPPPTTAEDRDADERARARAASDLFEACVWINRVKLVCDLRTMRLMDRDQLNAEWWMVGDPSDGKQNAWATFMRAGDRRRSVQSITYRPGAALFVHEEDEGGECLNLWQAPSVTPPAGVRDAQVRLYLEHLAYLIPDARERKILLDWQAWVLQNPGLKPNWGVLIGSPHQGNGKSILMEPMRAGLGRKNVRTVTAEDMASGFSDWLVETKLFVVEEMHSFERKSTMNRLKNYLATPPDRLRVNPKYGKQFEIPNLVAGVFFTNHFDALALERTDRRFFVVWTEVAPRDEDYYRQLVEWLKAGGALLVAGWLLERDVSAFNPLGRAPSTEAKEDMRKAARSMLDEWIEDGIADELAPFATDLVSAEEVWLAIPENAAGRNGKPTRQRLGRILRLAGTRALTRLRLDDGERATLLSVRRHDMYADLGPEKLKELFLAQRAAQLAKVIL